MKKIGCLLMVFLMIFASACSGSEEQGNSGQMETMELKIGIVNNTAHPSAQSLHNVFKPRLEELSGGMIEVSIYDSGMLGSERDMMEQVQTGTLQMCLLTMEQLGTVDPTQDIFSLPWLIADDAHVDRIFADQDLVNDLTANLPSAKIVGLGYMVNGFGNITNKVKPINSLADLKGMKIRTPEVNINIAIFQALGANVTPIPFTDLYSSLQTGVVDGQENPYNTIATQSLFEVQTYVTETRHMFYGFCVTAGSTWWESLSRETRDMITQVVPETTAYEISEYRAMTASSKQKCIDEGMEITTPDPAEFQEAVSVVYDDFYSRHPELRELAERIQALN